LWLLNKPRFFHGLWHPYSKHRDIRGYLRAVFALGQCQPAQLDGKATFGMDLAVPWVIQWIPLLAVGALEDVVNLLLFVHGTTSAIIRSHDVDIAEFLRVSLQVLFNLVEHPDIRSILFRIRNPYFEK